MSVLNPTVYEWVLQKKHHAQRKPFPAQKAALWQDTALAPVARMSLRLCTLLREETPFLLPEQNIALVRTVGNPPHVFSEKEWAKVSAENYIHELGYVSNLCVDYKRALTLGLDKIRYEAVERMDSADRDGQLFLQSMIAEIDAVFDLCERYRKCAEDAGNRELAAVLARVPHGAPRTFHEALQMVRILNYTLWAEGEYHNTLGRFDQYMFPYYEASRKDGLSEEAAEKLLEEFFLSLNLDSDLYPGQQLGDNGQSMMLGGVTDDGQDAFNELSSMCLSASCRLKLIDPKINLRVSKNTPFERYIEATHLTKAGLGFPQYSNDDVVIPALCEMGYDLVDARNYSVAACWEFIVRGTAADVDNIGALSMPKMVQRASHKALCTAPDFDAFLDAVKAEIAAECDEICESVKGLYFIPAPFLSCLMTNCVADAKDISLGTKYNNYGVHGTGLSTAVDSLAAIRQYVFEEKSVAPETLLDALQKDFAGYEELLHKLRYETGKMGNNIDEIDALASVLLNCFADCLEGRKNERGGIFRPGTGSAMFYLRHAYELEASADGRRKNEAFGTNFSPSLYVKSKGPFSVIQSFTKCPVARACNGGPLTMEFHSTVFDTEDGIENVARLVKQYTDMGGHQLQLNSINRDRLLAAQADPDSYRNMIVRIWGWSAYFVELDKEFQDHLIERQEFVLS